MVEKNKFYFKKSKGQNFLRNKEIIDRIIMESNLNKDKTAVIEIGPGDGALTSEIIKKCKKLILIEVDKQLISVLEEKFKKYDNFSILNIDVLKINLQELIQEQLGDFDKKNIVVISNLPYYITSPILFKLFSISNFISSFVLMMQKEVGERILADVNEKKYNNLSIVSKLYCDIKKVVTVTKDNFYPVPKVDSIVLNFYVNKKYIIDKEVEFIRFIRNMFNNKRKMVSNNLCSYLKSSDKKNVNNLLLNCNVNPMFRPENLTLENYHDIWNKILEENKL